MFPQRGANKYVDPQLVERNWPDHVRGLFVSGYALFEETTRAAARLAIEKARAANVPVAIDPASYANILDVGVDRFLEWCEGATIILPNRHEASVLAGGAAMSSELSNPQVHSAGSPSAPAGLDVQFDMDDVLDRLSRLFPTVVVKLDREGAIVRSGTDTVFVPAQSVPVVDTTGAGDAFNRRLFRRIFGRCCAQRSFVCRQRPCGTRSSSKSARRNTSDLSAPDDYLRRNNRDYSSTVFGATRHTR